MPGVNVDSQGEPVISLTRVIDSAEVNTWIDLFTVPEGKTLYIYHLDASAVMDDPGDPTDYIFSVREKPCGQEQQPPTTGNKWNGCTHGNVPMINLTSDVDDPLMQFNGGTCVAVRQTGQQQQSPIGAINLVGVLR